MQPWGGEAGAGLVQESATVLSLDSEILQDGLPFDWQGIWGKLWKWYGPSVKIAIRGLVRRKGKDVILCFDPMCGLIFASTARLLRLETPPIVISMFLLRPWKYPFMDRLRYAFANFGLKRVSKIICFSSVEVARYKKEFPRHAEKFRFVPVGADPTSLDLEKELKKLEESSPAPFIFSGGTTNRDYHTLVKAMEGIPDVKLKIFAKKADHPGESQNLEFLGDVYGDDYEREILASTIVVLPLYDKCFASGQLTLLKAMELGKAIIATNAPGVRDYITDGVNGVLVPPDDPKAMASAIGGLLGDADRRGELGEAARRTHRESFTQAMSVSKIIAMAAEVAGAKSA
ncbi:MAG: glycosyltransferase family 4 protein [Thermoleophilia bacterium]|nr:glycosyltransferase family 4 protein [Thermoleophilia bacterium]